MNVSHPRRIFHRVLRCDMNCHTWGQLLDTLAPERGSDRSLLYPMPATRAAVRAPSSISVAPPLKLSYHNVWSQFMRTKATRQPLCCARTASRRCSRHSGKVLPWLDGHALMRLAPQIDA